VTIGTCCQAALGVMLMHEIAHGSSAYFPVQVLLSGSDHVQPRSSIITYNAETKRSGVEQSMG
jgi:hypothetical protein